MERALSFGAVAAAYDSHRPGYPAAAVRWAVGEGPARVVDLGAGTGILSRVLAALGHQVIPVEPDPAMRARLAAVSPDLAGESRAGTAEAIPLGDGSVDAVVSGQAHHWFDPEQAHAEAARVLRPGGALAALWNRRDHTVPWVAELGAVTDDDTAGGAAAEPRLDEVSFGPGFGAVERASFPHEAAMTPDGLVALVATRSDYLTASERRRAEMEQAVRRLCARHPALAGRDTLVLPYVTHAFRAVRRP